MLVTAELLFQKGKIPDANFIFRHALIQDSAYQAPLRKHRQQLHLQLAEAIAHLEQGLRLVLEMPESGERDKLELGFRWAIEATSHRKGIEGVSCRPRG